MLEQTEFVRPEPFTAAELERARALRTKFAAFLPADFDSDFFLGRWLRAFKGDEAAIEQKLRELIAHRRAFGYDQQSIVEFCERHPIARQTFERFAISSLKMDVFSDDCVVFVQRMAGTDLKEIMKVMPLSNVLHSYFFLHECFQRAMHEHEKRTGRPAAVVVVLDLQGLNISEFINPLSTSSKLARLVVQIWSSYFSENMIRLFLINPPGVLSLLWTVAKHIVDQKTQSRLMFVSKLEDIFAHLRKEAIPEAWGGTRRDDSGYAPIPEQCVRAPLPVAEADHFTAERFWKREHGFSAVPDTKSVGLKSKNVHEVTKECAAGQKLVWLFTVNSDVTFEIALDATNNNEEKAEERLVWPRVTLQSLKTPEIGHLVCPEAGVYRVRFGNVSSSWLSSKLTYSIEVK